MTFRPPCGFATSAPSRFQESFAAYLPHARHSVRSRQAWRQAQMDAAFGLGVTPPTAGPRITFAGPNPVGAGHASDRQIAIGHQRVPRQVSGREHGLDLRARPAGKRVDLSSGQSCVAESSPAPRLPTWRYRVATDTPMRLATSRTGNFPSFIRARAAVTSPALKAGGRPPSRSVAELRPGRPRCVRGSGHARTARKRLVSEKPAPTLIGRDCEHDRPLASTAR